MLAAEIAERIEQEWARFLQSTRTTPSPHKTVYASAWRPCERRMVYELTRADQQPPWDVDVLARFRRGDDRERDLLADLARIGRDADPPFRIIGQQERFELRDRRGRPVISGKVDARAEICGRRVPVEVKAWSPFIVDSIERFEDLLANQYTRAGAHQLLAYCFGAGEPFGLLVLDRSGLPKLLPVDLEANLEHVEAFLEKATRAVDHAEAGTLPDFHDDAQECQRCPWYAAPCDPPLRSEPIAVLTDPDLEKALEGREQTRRAARDFEDYDAYVKQRLRGVEHAVIGSFEIVGRWSKSTSLVVPDEIRKQYTRTNDRGRFTLTITKL